LPQASWRTGSSGGSTPWTRHCRTKPVGVAAAGAMQCAAEEAAVGEAGGAAVATAASAGCQRGQTLCQNRSQSTPQGRYYTARTCSKNHHRRRHRSCPRRRCTCHSVPCVSRCVQHSSWAGHGAATGGAVPIAAGQLAHWKQRR